MSRANPLQSLPYRGRYGAARPAALDGIVLPPRAMPSHRGLRPLKSWRYVGVFGPELMLCLAMIRIGPAGQSFWAVWDRSEGRLYEDVARGSGAVQLLPGQARITAPEVLVELTLAETDGVETVSRSGASYAWTRKQGGIRAQGQAVIDGRARRIAGRAIVDDTAAYYERHTHWYWSAGVGTTGDGRALAWNLTRGVHDSHRLSERTVWLDGQPREVGPVDFTPDLTRVGGLGFSAEATLERRQNLLLVRSRYRQPFGIFSGEPLPGLILAEGYGVMEDHDVWW